MALRRTAFLFRMLLALALIVAAAPINASEPVSVKKPSCGMACCAKKAMAVCMDEPSEARIAAPCKCELKPGHAMPSLPAKAVLTVVLVVYAPAASADPVVPAALILAEPELFGADSSPPRPPQRRSDSSRAPPVVRA